MVHSGAEQIFCHGETSLSRIPQLDGPIPDPYDDVLSTPNVSVPPCFLL